MFSVLVITADPLLRQRVAACAAPARLLAAPDGLRGLDLLREHVAALRVVVVDLATPPLEGRLLCAQIRLLAPFVAVVPVTAQPDLLPFLVELGCLPPLVPPLPQALLAERLARAVRDPAPAPPLALLQLIGQQASQAEQEVRQAQARCRVVVLAHSPLKRAALARTIASVAYGLEAADRAAAHPHFARQHVTAVLADHSDHADAAALGRTYDVPVVIVATTAAQAKSMARSGVTAVVVEADPAAPTQLAQILFALAAQRPLLVSPPALPAVPPLVPPAIAAALRAAGLTQREQAVVWLDAQGWPLSAIAHQLTVKPVSITSYWKRIQRKRGADRPAVRAWVRGLLDQLGADGRAARAVGAQSPE